MGLASYFEDNQDAKGEAAKGVKKNCQMGVTFHTLYFGKDSYGTGRILLPDDRKMDGMCQGLL